MLKCKLTNAFVEPDGSAKNYVRTYLFRGEKLLCRSVGGAGCFYGRCAVCPAYYSSFARQLRTKHVRGLLIMQV